MANIINSNNTDTIYFYFDTVESKLSMQAFSQMVESLDCVTNNISQVFLGEKSKCNIFILPPEDGSFKSVFAVTVVTIALGLSTNFGDGVIQGLTGHDTKYYGNQVGEFVKDATIGMFAKTKDELDKIIPDNIILDSAINAKSKFYLSVINDKNIKSLGFSKTDKTLIKRQNMGAYIAEDKIRDIENVEEYARLTIIKPVTVKSQQAWTLKDHAKSRNDDYKIQDEDFKNRVWSGENPLKEFEKPDEILAKVEYVKEMKNGIVSTTETNIKEVYQFNNNEFKKLPEDFKLNEPKKKKKTHVAPGQINLFEQEHGNEEETNA